MPVPCAGYLRSYKLLRYPAQGTGISSRGCWTSILSFILVITVRVVLTYSLFADQYQYVDLKDGIYSKTVSYKRVSIDPQPDPSSILTLRRMYFTVCWLGVTMNTYVVWIWSNILDYCNLFSCCGEWRRNDFRPTDAPFVIWTQRWHWMARLVHQETWNRYKTQNTNRRKKPNLQTDDLQHLLSILGDHPYIQEVIQLKGKPTLCKPPEVVELRSCPLY
jgi:hypothetical protein